MIQHTGTPAGVHKLFNAQSQVLYNIKNKLNEIKFVMVFVYHIFMWDGLFFSAVMGFSSLFVEKITLHC